MATQYLKVAGAVGKFVMFDDTNSHATIIIRSDLQTEKTDLTARIATADPNIPKVNADWIAWAKANYPHVDHSAEQTRLDQINIILDAIKAL
jgi:hypothetical protein